MRNEQYKLEDSIVQCLERHPGSSAKKIYKFCKNKLTPIPDDKHAKSTIFSRLRKMKRKRKVINKANSWYLLIEKDKD